MTSDLTPELQKYADRFRKKGRELSRQLREKTHRQAIDFIRIEDPWSYQCPTSEVTATDIIRDWNRLFVVPRMYDLIAFGQEPPTLRQLLWYEEAKRVTDEQPTLHYDTHTVECQPCKTYHDLYVALSCESGQIENEFLDLLHKPFGRLAWNWTLAALRAERRYATFDDYFQHHKRQE